jgi:hypothetical protein
VLETHTIIIASSLLGQKALPNLLTFPLNFVLHNGEIKQFIATPMKMKIRKSPGNPQII